MSSETLLTIFAILFKFSIILILANRPELDEELERMLRGSSLWDESFFREVEKFSTSDLGPNIAYVISHAQFYSYLERYGRYSCDDNEIQNMKNFHNFMLTQSEGYRNIDVCSKVICSFISIQWNYVMKCLVKENEGVKSRLQEEKWKLQARMMKKFWRITSIKGDIYFLSIASDLSENRRRIREAREIPNEWATMLRGMLVEEYKSNLNYPQGLLTKSIYEILYKVVKVESISELEYPNSNCIAKLYDLIIAERCGKFQEDELLVKSLEKAEKLAEITQWPKIWNEDDKIFATKLDESNMDYLTLGLVVCKQMDENTRKQVIENGAVILQALGNTIPSDSGKLDENELEEIFGMKSEFSITTTANRAITDFVEPETAYVIQYARSFGKGYNFPRENEEIERMLEFHNFMLDHSTSYRNMKFDQKSIRIFNCHQWRLMVRSLNEESKTLKDHLLSYDPGMARKFWKITSSIGDVFYLNIASDIVAGKRKIRGARECPREWAQIFEESLRWKFSDVMQQQREIEDYIYKYFVAETESKTATGLSYPQEDHIAKLYDLVLEQCRRIQDNHLLVESLQKVAKLAQISHWPKSYNLSGFGFKMGFDDHLLGPLTLNLVVCNRLDDRFRKEAIDNKVAVIDAFIKRSDWSELDEDQLEGLLASDRKDLIGFKARKIPTSNLDPDLAYVIKNVKKSPLFEKLINFNCSPGEIGSLKDLHDFMLQKSKQYKNLGSKSTFIRLLIDGHWKYAIECIEREIINLGEKLNDYKWYSLAKMGAKFWKITSAPRDLYSLGIVSDLSGGRKVRDARDSPRDWAQMIKSLLQQEMIETYTLGEEYNYRVHQESTITEVNNLLKKEMHVDDATGVRYPQKGYIDELYNRLISQRCKIFQDDKEILRSLQYIAELARLTQWPKRGRREEGLFTIDFHETLIGLLVLGLIVCNELGEQYRNAAGENEIAIFDALTSGIQELTSSNTVSLLFARESFIEICERSQNFMDILQTACNSNHIPKLRILFEQMAKLKQVVELAPHNFLCEEQEIEKMELFSKSIARILPPVTNRVRKSFERLVGFMTEMREQFVYKCLISVVTRVGILAHDETKRHILKMPRFWLFMGKESLPSLKDCLIYAGSLLDGTKKVPDILADTQLWLHIMEESTRDMVRIPPDYIPTGMKEYWKQVWEELSLNKELNGIFNRKQFLTKKVYNEFIMGWCNIFEPNTVHLQSKYIKEVERVVEVVSFLVRWGYRIEYYFSNFDVEAQDEFVLRQSVLGYSVCIHLDPRFTLVKNRTITPFTAPKLKTTTIDYTAGRNEKLKKSMQRN